MRLLEKYLSFLRGRAGLGRFSEVVHARAGVCLFKSLVYEVVEHCWPNALLPRR